MPSTSVFQALIHRITYQAKYHCPVNEQKKAAMEKTFYHDIGNLINGLRGMGLLLRDGEDPLKVSSMLDRITQQLTKEIELQKGATQEKPDSIDTRFEETFNKEIWEDITAFTMNHPDTKGRDLELIPTTETVAVYSDVSLIMRVIRNMITNALEASSPGDKVKIWEESDAGQLTFCVWNSKAIPELLQQRIFQRNFSTKPGYGRGLGTFSMKLNDEKTLGGQIAFESNTANGTTFKFSLPRYEKTKIVNLN